MKGLIVAIGSIVSASAALALELTGTQVVTSDTTISEKVTGSGGFVVDNGARLTLSGAGNDFTGGVIVSNGFLRADASGAFGTGPISLESEATDRTVELNVQGGEFHNDLTQKDATTGSHPAVHVLKSAKWYGKMTMDPALAEAKTSSAYLTVQLGSASGSKSDEEFYMYGDIDVSVSRFRLSRGGNAWLSGKVVADTVLLGDGWSDCGRMSFGNPENRIRVLQIWRFTVNCSAANVLRDTHVYMRYNSAWGQGGGGFFRPCGYDQEISDIYADCSSFGASEYGYQIEGQTDKPATLTLNGKYYEGSSAYIPSYARISGKINIVVDDKREDTKNDWLAPIFKGRSSSMEGTMLTKKNGQLRIGTGATFLNVTNLTVAADASFTCESVAAVAFGDNLRQITVAGNGYIRCEGTSTTPICSKRARLDILSADPLKQLRFESTVENTVSKLFVGGARKHEDVYTCDNLAQMRYTDASPRYYKGSLTVLRGPGAQIFFR